MRRSPLLFISILLSLVIVTGWFSGIRHPAHGAEAPKAPIEPALGAGEKTGRFPHVEFSVAKRQVRVECQALAVDAPLEFFVCLAGTNEHEAVLRTTARPSDIHTALLAIGLKPGAPLTYIESTRKYIPPQGPPLHISVEYQKDGKAVTYPAYRWLREIKSKKEPAAFNWVFCGSRVTQDGRYAADDTGYVLSIVNFDFTMIDVPQLASSSNEELEWERNAALMPAKGTTVWMIIEPTGGAALAPATTPNPTSAPTTPPEARPATQPSGAAAGMPQDIVHLDDARMQELIKYHEQVVAPRADALRQAAQAHYEVIASLRKEQQRLISEADLLQRTIDELERRYSDLTTPHPPGEVRLQPGEPSPPARTEANSPGL